MAANPRALPLVLLFIATSLVLLSFVLRSDAHYSNNLSVTRALWMCKAFEPKAFEPKAFEPKAFEPTIGPCGS